MLHLIVSINHVVFSAPNIVRQLLNLRILSFYFFPEILCLIFGSLNYTYNFVKLPILVSYHFFLMLKNLSIIQVSSLVIFPVFAAGILLFLLLSCQISLIIFDRAVFLGELSLNQLLNLCYQTYAALDLLLAHARVLVRFICVVVIELIKVRDICLKSGPCSFHEVLLTSDRLSWSCISNLINLGAEPLNSILCISVVALEVVSAHFYS